MINREKIIKNYIDGYNQFDIDKMVNSDRFDDVSGDFHAKLVEKWQKY